MLKKFIGVQSNKPRGLDPMVLEAPRKSEGIQVEIRGESKTVVGWINGTARQRPAIGNIQRQLRGCWDGMANTWNGETDWVVHILREAYAWAEQGAKIERSERVDERRMVFLHVTGICGFWDGSCWAAGCGAGMWLNVFTRALGWHNVHFKSEPVPGGNSLDAEIWVCSMTIVSMDKWIDKCVS